MAEVLGSPEDAVHWNATVNFPGLGHQLENLWEVDTPGMFASTKNGIGFSNLAYAANSMFPRDWVVTMAQEWMDNSVGFNSEQHAFNEIFLQEKGFYGEVPLTRRALQDWDENVNDNFAVVPGKSKIQQF